MNNRYLHHKILIRNLFEAAALVLVFILAGACRTRENQPRQGNITAAVWNVAALFDGEDAGNEYAEFRKAAGWTKEKYTARLLSLAQAITRMVPKKSNGPDLVGLVELENQGILEDLIQGPLSKQGYLHTFFGNEAGMPLGLGVISRFPLMETKIHSAAVDGKTPPRPILEIKLEPEGSPLIFFLCHWKSKVGGAAATEPLRRTSALIIRRRLRELEQEEPETPVIVMGDLNENHDEFYRQGPGFPSALLPDDPNAAELAKARGFPEDHLILSREKPPRARCFSPGTPALYTPWGTELENGSYYYRNNWETIDHLLLSSALFDQKGWDFAACSILNHQPFIGANNRPASYNVQSGLGLSDHLPLLLVLTGTPGL